MDGLPSENLIQKFLQEYSARKPLARPIIPVSCAPPVLYNNDFLATSSFPSTVPVPVAPVPTPTLVHLETTTGTPNRSQTDSRQHDRQTGLPTAENEKALLAILASKLRPAGQLPRITNLGHQLICPRYSNPEAPADNCSAAESETKLGQQVAIPLGPHHDKLPDKCNIGFQSNCVKMVQGSYVVNTTLDHGYSYVLKDTTTPTSTSKDVRAKTDHHPNRHDRQKASSGTDSDSDVESDQTYQDLVAKLQAASKGCTVGASGPDRKSHNFHPDLVVTSIDALVLERMNAIELASKNEKLAAEARAAEAASPRPASSPTKKKTAAARKAEDKSAKLEPKDVKEKPAAKGKKTPKDKPETPAPTSPLLHQTKAATPAVMLPAATPPSLVHCYPPSRLALQLSQPATCVSLNCNSVVFDPKVGKVSARFLLEGKDQLLGVPPGQFILMTISAAEGRKLCRPVFPVSSCDSLGFVDIIWDLQTEDIQQSKALPSRRSFGQALLRLKLGDPVMVSGPYGQLLYLKSGWISHQNRFSRPEATKPYKHVLFFGTTFVALPYFAMVEQACRERASIQFTLLHIGFTENDFMIEEKLEELSNTSPAICKYYPILLGSAICSDWKEELQDSLVAKFLPPPIDGCMIVVCANPPFARNYLLPALDAVGMDEEAVDRFVYGDVGRDFTASSI